MCIICNLFVYSLRTVALWLSMMTLTNGTFSASLPPPPCEGNSQVTEELLSERPVTRSFDIFFDLRLNKRLSKQTRCWRFDTPSRPLWRHCNASMFCEMTWWYTPLAWPTTDYKTHELCYQTSGNCFYLKFKTAYDMTAARCRENSLIYLGPMADIYNKAPHIRSPNIRQYRLMEGF